MDPRPPDRGARGAVTRRLTRAAGRLGARARRSGLLPRLLWVGARVTAPASQRAAGWFAWQLWTVPWRPRPPRSARPVEQAVPLAVDCDGVLLRGHQAGEGPTVLLVHGWADRSSSLAAFVGPLVDAGYRVVAVDLPAHGSSPGFRATALVFAKAIGRLAERYEAQVVVAHSLGAFASVLALLDGMAVRGLVLIAPMVRLSDAVVDASRMMRLPAGAGRGLQVAVERRFGPDVWDNFALDRRVADADTPVLVVHDRDDRQTAIDGSRTLAQAWPTARLVETGGLGHRRVLRDADVVEQVSRFVREHARPPEPGEPARAGQA